MVTSGTVDAAAGLVGLVGSVVLMVVIDWVLLLVVVATVVVGGVLVVRECWPVFARGRSGRRRVSEA